MNPQTEEIRRALSLLFPDGAVLELRALGDNSVHSGYFNDFDKMAERAKTIDTFTGVHGVYVTLNVVNPALLSRRANRVKQRLSRSDATTADADIIRRRWLPIDFDPVRPSGVSATDEEHEAALRQARDVAHWLTGIGFPEPIMADSGNGAHLLYQIDLPNDGESLRIVKTCLTVLDALFSDDTVHCDTANFNAGRIWKCYGTTARKGDDTTARPHRKAHILSAPDEPAVVPEEMLRELADTLPRSAPPEDRGRRKGSFDLGRWLDKNGIAVRTERPWQGGTLFSLAECPFSTAHTDGAFAIQFSNGAIFAGCHHDSCGGGAQRWQELRAMYEPEQAGKIQNRIQKTTSPDTIEESSPLSPLPDTSAEEQENRKRALELLTTGDPVRFLLDVFHRDHVGDRTVAECLIMSVASQSVENTSGLHVAISGNSGKGKTHACNAMARLLPEEYRLTGTVSDKALFYHDSLRPGSVLLFDDVSLSDDMQEVLKSATANFREPIQHRTLTTDRQLKVCTIPERCVWWLAKVESIGDDQVMNRMLSVWIDDSKEQDQAVLDYMKQREAQRRGEGRTDADIDICHEMWNVIKQQIFHVRIPFSPQICFHTTNNRRNPAMLFDLIKCHAVLHFCQRDRDEEGSIIASRADFTYARSLFLSICGDAGGQETKQTRNESAALATIMKLGLEIFTIRQLQDALGLSYNQTYRLLHGYYNSKARYTGILDKCPAVGLIDATVAEEICGIPLKRKEHHFSFNREIYREWMEKGDVWIADSDDDSDDDHPGPDSCTPSTSLHPRNENITDSQNGCNGEYSSNKEQYEEICTDTPGCLHVFAETHSTSGEGDDSGTGFCESGMGANKEPEYQCSGQVAFRDSNHDIFSCKTENKAKKTDEKVQINRQKGTMNPLPGILDHQDFQRSTVILGSCSICGEGPAVYSSKEQRAAICEGCYARLVREWNRKNGVA